MSRIEIPEWVTRMLSSGGEPVRLSDDDFVKLDSFVPKPFQRFVVFPNSPEAKEIERYNTLVTRLVVLRDYNRKLRENGRPSEGNQAPRTSEEALAQGYVQAKVIVALFPDHFSSASALTKYLDNVKRQKLIRCFKETSNRRWVHSGDVLNTLYGEYVAAQKAFAKGHELKRPRGN